MAQNESKKTAEDLAGGLSAGTLERPGESLVPPVIPTASASPASLVGRAAGGGGGVGEGIANAIPLEGALDAPLASADLRLLLDQAARDEQAGKSDRAGAERGADREANAQGNENEVLRHKLALCHPCDIAGFILELKKKEERQRLLRLLPPSLYPKVFAELEDGVREELTASMSAKELAEIVRALDGYDAIGVLEQLGTSELGEVLSALTPQTRALFEENLSYQENSIGRLMRRDIVTVPAFWRVGQVIDYLRARRADLPTHFYVIFLVNRHHHLIGSVPLSRLLSTRRGLGLREVAQPGSGFVATQSTTEIAPLFRRYGLVEAPIVDYDNRLLGSVTIDDIVEILEEEAAEDLLHLSNVSSDDLYDNLWLTVRARGTWLFVNLLTVLLAALAIHIFDHAIEEIVALAVLMPVIASMGGNAGTQTLAITVRALGSDDGLTPARRNRLVLKELAVSFFNGLIFASISAVLTFVWFARLDLSLLIAFAMVVNLIVAGLTGALIPISLDRLKLDPAVGAGVILTTITDLVGFGVFLGLAAWLLL